MIKLVYRRPVAKLAGLLLALASLDASAARWSGYINTETFVDQQYGYMSIRKDDAVYSAVRLVCFPPVGFRIYVDRRLFPDAVGDVVTFSVDSLPPHTISTTRTSTEFVVTEEYPEFWDLVAQMVAGAKVGVRADTGSASMFALSGFSDAYDNACAWMGGSDGYLEHLDDYQ